MWIVNNFILTSSEQWLSKIEQLLNTMIRCIMPLFMDMVINFKFVNFNQNIMCTCSEQHRQCWTWLLNTLFYGCKRCCLIVLLLEGQDDQTWKDRVHNCTLCHLPNVDGQIDPSLAVDPIKWLYMLCGQSIKVAIILIYDKCSKGWHMVCIMLPLEEIIVEKWFCL